MTNGYCPTDCGNNFLWYLGLLSFGSFIASTGTTGNSLFSLRCVDPRDKSFAMGIIGTVLAVVGEYQILVSDCHQVLRSNHMWSGL